MRPASTDGCPLLIDAMAQFDTLVTCARARRLTADAEVVAAFGIAVDAIAAELQAVRSGHCRSGGRIDWVLVDRAAARFSTRIDRPEVRRLICPRPVTGAIAGIVRLLAMRCNELGHDGQMSPSESI